MKKMVGIALGLLLMLVIFGPLLGAHKSQQSLDLLVEHLNQAGYRAEWHEYDRGWLRSRAVLSVHLQDAPEWLGESGALPWVFDIHHGPVIVTQGLGLSWFTGTVQLEAEREQWLLSLIQAEESGPLLQSRFDMSLLGRVSLTDRILPFYIEEGGTSLRVGGYKGEGRINARRQLYYAGALRDITMSQPGNLGFQLEQLEFVVNSDLSGGVKGSLVPGEFLFSLAALVVDDYAGEPVSTQGFSASTKVVFNDAQTLADVNLKAQFDRFILDNADIQNAELNLQLERVSLVFIEQYLDKLAARRATGQPPAALLRFQLLSLALTEWIPHGPSIDIQRLSFDSNYGPLSIAASLSLAPEAAQLRNPMALTQHLEVYSDIRIGKPLAFELSAISSRNELRGEEFVTGKLLAEEEFDLAVQEQARMKLDQLVGQGMFIDEGETYRSRFLFKEGRALLNDQPIPLPF